MNRRADIDRAKGFAIILVVFGHLVARADPAGVFWYEPLRRAVYAFHMPFFLYLSGLVAALSGTLFGPLAAWPELARRRAIRLLGPFFLLGLIVVLGKILAAPFLHVDNSPASLGAGLRALLWHTAASPALSIWYLFVLFVLSLACPLVLQGRTWRLIWLIGIALVIYALPLPAYMYLDRIGRYAIFFVLGAAAGAHDAAWRRFMDRWWLFAFGLLLTGCTLIALTGAAWPPALTLLPMGMIAMPALHGLMRRFPNESLLRLGRYSFIIYLLNTMFIGLSKGVMLRALSWNGSNFILFAIVMSVAGLAGPIALKKALPRGSQLDRLTN